MADFVQFGTVSGLGLPAMAGGDSGVLAFSALTQDQGLLFKPNTGAASLGNWTLALDIHVPAGQGTYMALLQTDTGNASDADLFLKTNAAPATAGIGISGNYAGSFDYGSWERVVVTAETSGGSTLLSKYVDGALAGTQTLSGTRWTINEGTGFLLLADEDGETASGALSSVMFADRALTATEVAALGGADADGIAATPVSAKASQFDFTAASYAPSYGPAALSAPGDTDPAPVPDLAIAERIMDVMRTPGSSVQIDLSEVFNRDDITLSVAHDDAAVITSAGISGEVLTLELGALGHADVRVTATDAEGNSVTDSLRVRVAGPNAYTIAVLPDTQDYTDSSLTNGPPQTFYNMTQWLVDNKAAHNIVFVGHVGDITQNNLAPEWVVANTALSKLDGVIPYSVLPGNHDQALGGSAADHSSGLDAVFSPGRQAASNPGTFGGVYDQEPERGVNNFHSFTAPDGTKWLVLSLEFGPRDDVIRWAGGVIEAHLDHRVMLLSHALTDFAGRHDPAGGPLYDEGAGYDYGMGRDPEGANDGETVYRELLARYPNIALTFSGHIFGDGAETNVSYGQHGNAVIESLVNYQNGISREITGNGDETLGTRGGNGAMRLVVIDPDNNRISTETYFTEFDDYLDGFRVKPELDRDGLTGPYRGHEEVFTDMAVGTPELAAIAKAGNDVFTDAGPVVTLDAGGSLDPADSIVARIWYDAEGHAVGAGETSKALLGPGRHHLTLAVTDEAGRVTTDGKLVVVSDAGTMLLENFNDGDAEGWGAPGVAEALAVGTPESFAIPALPGGGAESVAYVPALSAGKGLLLSPNLGVPSGFRLPTYSLVFDILVPEGQGTWTSLAQLNTANADDGDLFLRRNADGTGGIGISGNYQGSFAYGEWQRVAFTVTPASADTLLLTKYIEGAKVGSQVVSAERFSVDLSRGLLFFSDEDGETSNLYVSSLLVTEKVFTDEEVAALGGAAAGGILDTAPTPLSAQFDFSGADLAASFGPATLSFGDIGGSGGAGNFLVKGSVFSRDAATPVEAAPEARLYDQSDAAANILVWKDPAALGWTDYRLEATIRSTDNDQIGLVFRFQDEENHYRVVLDGEANLRSLVRIRDGVETVLAQESGGTRFNTDQELSVAIADGRINLLLDGRSLFGGPVLDAEPLAAGTVGLYSSSQRSSQFDNVTVNELRLAAHAGEDLRALDLDGNGREGVAVDAGASFGAAAVTGWEWSDARGTVLATGETALLDLAAGRHELTLTVTDAEGNRASDTVRVEVVAEPRILLAEDFSGPGLPAGWRIVDEGEMGGIGPDGTASDWQVQDGELVQLSDLRSRELTWNGATNADLWQRGWSPLGDGVKVLRAGTYALYEDPAATSWEDYSIEARIRTPDNDGLGFLVHYRDARNHYKLELDADGAYDRDPGNGAGPVFNLIRMRDGVEEILGQVPQRYTPGESFHLRLDILDNRMTAWIDGEEIFAYGIEDRAHAAGSVALYAWGNAGLAFDDLRVVSLEGVPDPYALPEFLTRSGTGPLAASTATPYHGEVAGLVFEEEGGAGADTILGTGAADRIRGAGGHDSLEGLDGADSLAGGEGQDILKGGAGDDSLHGGLGRDRLWGGSGDDRFVLTSAAQSTPDALRDVIQDWGAGDAIDLSGLDGQIGIPGLQGFVFRGTSLDPRFARGGEVWTYQYGGNTYVVGGVDGDTQRDFQLEIRGLHDITADRILGVERAWLLGGAGADTLTGTAGADTLSGGGGGDVLIGGPGKDRMSGGAGADRFVFAAAEETPAGTGRDVITDFTPGADLIDLSAMDANGTVAGQQGFTWRGLTAAPFTAAAGDLWWYQFGGNTYLVAGLDGDDQRDLQIELLGLKTLSAADILGVA